MPVWVCSCTVMDTCVWMSADNIGWNSPSMFCVWLETAISHCPGSLASRLPVHLPTSGITTTCYYAWIWKPSFINSLPMSHNVVWSHLLPTSPLLLPSSTSTLPPTLSPWFLRSEGQGVYGCSSLGCSDLGHLTLWHSSSLYLFFKFSFFFFFWEFHACVQQNMKTQEML